MTLAYDLDGQGTPLVLLHAFPYDRRMWAPQRDEFARVCRVLTPDLPGCGRSPDVPGVTIDGMADAVVRCLDLAGISEPVVVGGLSMGGYVALAFARKYPDRLRGLILADTRAEPDDDAGKTNRDKAIAAVKADGTVAFAEAQLPKQLGPTTPKSRPDVVDLARRIGTAQRTEGIVSALAALRDRPDARPGLILIRVPTLILVGEDDAITPPPMAEAMQKGIEGSRLVRIPGAGHLSNLENAAAFNAAVQEFLRTV
jgi:pimeloyl-ACP methyl ester carboxylesterase